jgi:hypothetical protein
MIKKFAFIGLAVLVVFLLTVLSIVYFKGLGVGKENVSLKSRLLRYEKEELKLVNMQRTVETIYNLTPYEARYYSIIFKDFSEKYNLPWEAFPALVRIESNFNSGVMSKERAKGMTQVLEETGKNQAGKLGIPFNDNTLWNCVLNMVIGFDFFCEGYAEKIKSTPQEQALKHAMQRYCGGPGYANINPDAKIYVREYKSTLWDEYKRVSYVYKGVQFDRMVAEDSVSQSEKQKPKTGILSKIKWTQNKSKFDLLADVYNGF